MQGKELGGTGIRDGKLEKMRALFPYMGRFRTALVSYKFEKSLALGNFFARCMPRALAGLGLETLEESAWVPVPPRPGKIKRQGWDQVDYLAALLEREWRRFSGKTGGAGKPGPEGANPLPARRCLKRLPSRSQKELNREERGSNLAGRILCAKPPPKTAILFDDVITTGATLRACAAALREGGAEKVYGICLFYD